MAEPALPKLYSGKVRDIYDAGDDRLLMVTSDRFSAFDVVFDEPIPDKGRVLTAMSAFWFERFADLVPGHLIATSGSEVEALGIADDDPELAGRVMLTRKAEMLPIECIVRGYITGSAWKDYRATGAMNGVPLPDDLLESSKLPEPVFTPSSKAEVGDHDENISFERAVDLIGQELADQARAVSLRIYQEGADWAAERGIILADTKFELGVLDGELILCDEVLTPDSSRFWPADRWVPGTTPPSFDKQPVRNHLEAIGWDKTPPPPSLGDDIVAATRARYVEAYERITGRDFAQWPGVGA